MYGKGLQTDVTWIMSFQVEKLPAVSFMEKLEKAPAVDDSTVVEAVSVNNSAAEALAAEG